MFQIPVRIRPTFWLFAAVIGFLISHSLVGMVTWVALILVSVLFHEYGHALTAAAFGRRPQIELVALGGLTYHDGEKLALWKQFLIVLNGPLFGLLLFGLATAALHIPRLAQGAPGELLLLVRNVNLFWTIMNLVPVIPLDGSQLLQIVLEAVFGVRGFKYAVITSLVLALLISLGFFLAQGFLIGALFFFFAFQSYDTLRKTRHLSQADRDDSLKNTLTQVEESIQLGNKQQALLLCNEIRSKVKSGIIFEMATQYLALLHYEEGNTKEAYALLRSIQKELSGDALCLLHKAAFEQEDYFLVAKLAAPCFQIWPTAETALRNAYAHAQLGQPVPSVGWLQTAIEENLNNVSHVLMSHLFDPVRKDPSFQSLEKKHQVD